MTGMSEIKSFSFYVLNVCVSDFEERGKEEE